ncbi:hypothetical protein CI102_14292 [Trichoderma harzianum]|nr:hypothetical protein CI102_14292 [Trichoderma harzianum]
MEYNIRPFTFLDVYKTLICRECAFAVLVNEVSTHLLKRHRGITAAERRNLVRTAAELTPSSNGAVGHWIERSPHRTNVLPLYQRYVVDPTLSLTNPSSNKLAWRALIFPIWECGYVLNHFVFTQSLTIEASSKTALCLAQQLKYTRTQDQGTSLPKLLGTARGKDLSQVVVFDFGGRDTADQKVHASLASTQPLVPTTMISVGAEPKVLTAEERRKAEVHSASLGKLRMNTPNLRAAAIELLGEHEYFDGLELKWKEFLEAGVPGMNLKWGKSMKGGDGVGASWRNLCDGTKVQSDEGLVFRL